MFTHAPFPTSTCVQPHMFTCADCYTYVRVFAVTLMFTHTHLHTCSHAHSYMYTWLAKRLEVYFSDGRAFPLLGI